MLNLTSTNGSASRNNTTRRQTCLPVEDNIMKIPETLRVAYTCLFGLSILVGIPVHSLVIFLIKRTGQQTNQSIRLIMYMSILCGSACTIFNTIYITYMRFYEEIECLILYVLHTTLASCLLTTGGSAVAISVDRLFRIWYLNEYSAVLTQFRQQCLLCLYAAVTVCQTGLFFFGIYHFGVGYATLMTAPLNTIGLLVGLICYGLSIFKLKQHQQRSRNVSNNDRSIIKFATIQLALMAVSFVPLLIYQGLSPFLSEMVRMYFLSLTFYLIPNTPTISGILFVYINRECRRTFLRILRSFTPSNRIGDIQ